MARGSFNQALPMKQRFVGTEAMTEAAAQGLYNQLLFDLCSDDSILALSLFGSENPALNVIGFENSDVFRIEENFLTYVSSSGTAAATPSSGVQTDACAPGNGFEFGTCSFRLEGWGRLRRTTPVRDLTDIGERFCEKVPRYDVAGRRINNDTEWDMAQLGATLLNDFHRQIIDGDATNPGEADGLAVLVNYGYADPTTAEVCTAMDSLVVDWNGNPMCPVDGVSGADGVTVNGVAAVPATTPGYVLIDYIKSYVRRLMSRISVSSLSGRPNIISLIPTEHLSCLIDCYVCYVVCGRDITRQDSFEARSKIDTLKMQLMDAFAGSGAVQLTFDGVAITFFPYDYSLITAPTLADIYFLVTDIGNTPVLRFQTKDMTRVTKLDLGGGDVSSFAAIDGGRWLTWSNADNTCFRRNLEIQWRILSRTPWANARFIDVACENILGAFSNDPLSTAFFESNLVAAPTALDYVQV